MANSHPLKTRLKEAFKYLEFNKGIKQKDVAFLMKSSEPTISRNINAAGDGRINMDFLIKFNAAVGNIFNIQYIVDGNGALLRDTNTSSPNPSMDELTANVNTLDIMAQMIRKLDDARIELQNEIVEIRQLKKDLRTIITSMSHNPIAYAEHATTLLTAAETN